MWASPSTWAHFNDISDYVVLFCIALSSSSDWVRWPSEHQQRGAHWAPTDPLHPWWIRSVWSADLALLASDFIWACSNKTPQTRGNPTMPSIHPRIVNKEAHRNSWPLGMMAGVCKRHNNDLVSKMKLANETLHTFTFLWLANGSILQVNISLPAA